MKVTLGGDRLGAGKKNKQYLDNYHRSSHNLSQDWTSSMAVGVLYPFLVLPATRGDKFEINLNADCITIPTKGPLFGSFKLQVDVFECPVRLYQGILHNNPTAVGLKVSQIKLPKYRLMTATENGEYVGNSSLWKYLGLSGIGIGETSGGNYVAQRDVNAVPLLAYYDIFKNYYANKQEEKAYVIGTDMIEETQGLFDYANSIGDYEDETKVLFNRQMIGDYGDTPVFISTQLYNEELLAYPRSITLGYVDSEGNDISYPRDAKIFLLDSSSQVIMNVTALELTQTQMEGAIALFDNNSLVIHNTGGEDWQNTPWRAKGRQVAAIACEAYINKGAYTGIKLNAFDLKNIDDMRYSLLSFHQMGQSFRVDQQNYLPYSINTLIQSQATLNGLVLKTYQNDLFNNWLNTDWIDGENGIAEITKIDTENGLKIDALNLAEKLYNMLNRVAVAGNTYEDYLDAVYEPAFKKHMETPVYVGGMSSEIVFQKIASTAQTTNNDGSTNPLGSLAGEGRHIKRKGGHMYIKVDEPAYIIGIVSLTPRIKYSQGNEFYMTEMDSIADLHVPELDGIGFQNLLGERLAWWDTKLNANGTIKSRSVIGKVPAWIEYMTAVDKVYGDFAAVNDNASSAFMVLNRNYTRTADDEIGDATTYIDPTKYNYAFAYTALDAQNFWVEIFSKITARRLMSAKQIPNL